jgi:hypothetical protein
VTNTDTRRLPEPSDKLFLTEAGIETTMMYKKGWELRHFCLFELLLNDRFVDDVREYHTRLIEVALEQKGWTPSGWSSLSVKPRLGCAVRDVGTATRRFDS